jgi:ATP-dependent DNA helicase RecG
MADSELIKNGQGPRIAFLAKADAKSIAEILVAFANTEGGTIVIGITEDKKPSGAKLDGDVIQKALRNAEEMYNPTVVLDRWEEVQVVTPDEDDDEEDDDESAELDDSKSLTGNEFVGTKERVVQRELIPDNAPPKPLNPLDDVATSSIPSKDDDKPFIDPDKTVASRATVAQPVKIVKVQPVPFTVYTVRVPRSMELHALADGRVLIRSGAKNRPLGGQEILRLASAKSTGDFESELVPGATRDDFSRKMIDEYLEKRAERSKRPFNGKIDDLLQEIGAINIDGKPTMMGILLFTEYPQQWLPQSSVVFAKFVGTTPRGESGLAGYTRREELTGPLSKLIESAWHLIWSEMAVSAVVKGLEREEKTEYPAFAVREAIVNSICHRDYRLRGRRIEIRMYSDRLEVISPGGLPGFITVENIKDEHFSRNPRVVNGLFQWGYIEELGLGIDRMIEVMEQAGHRPPSFDARPYSFAVTLYNSREKQRPPEWARNTNYRQARALQYIKEHGSITNREYRNLCQGISAETLRLDLVDMVDKGILMKVGSKKGTHYILK